MVSHFMTLYQLYMLTALGRTWCAVAGGGLFLRLILHFIYHLSTAAFHLRVAPRLRMSGVIPPLPHTPHSVDRYIFIFYSNVCHLRARLAQSL
jgi:hypothetical protein